MKQQVRHGAELDFVTPDEIRELLVQGRGDGYSGVFDVLVGDFQGPEPVLMVNPPYRRLRVSRGGNGTDAFAVPAAAAGVAPTLVLPSNEGRLGGQIVNKGASPCFIYLGEVADVQGSERSGRGALWLSALGGSWDFEISSMVWGGTISAAGDGGATTLTIVEL